MAEHFAERDGVRMSSGQHIGTPKVERVMSRDEIREALAGKLLAAERRAENAERDAEQWLKENEKLREALRRTEGDLLRYGQHDSDCPARKYVLVDGIPTTCDCGLNLALDGARLAALGEGE